MASVMVDGLHPAQGSGRSRRSLRAFDPSPLLSVTFLVSVRPRLVREATRLCRSLEGDTMLTLLSETLTVTIEAPFAATPPAFLS